MTKISKNKLKEKIRKKENLEMKRIANLLKKENAFWMEVAYYIAMPKRKGIHINLSKINKETKEGDIVLVPGKVLSEGELDHKISIAALSFSKSAEKKLKGCKIVSIEELLKNNKEGKGIKLIK